MKKFSSVLLVLCLLLTLCATLASCGHECEFSPLWTGDATSHWHACKGEECTEIADKADHTWDAGKITVWATQDAAGVKTFTCTVCAQTKTESIAFAGMTETEWNAAFGAHLFENFEYKEVAASTVSGVTATAETNAKFTKELAWTKVVTPKTPTPETPAPETPALETTETYITDIEKVNEFRAELVDFILALANYENFQYDAATKTYKATADITITEEEGETTATGVTLTFANNKIAEITYSISIKVGELDVPTTSTITISNYGTVVITPPAPETPAPETPAPETPAQ